MAARHDDRRTQLGPKVDQRDHRGELHLGVGSWQVDPDVLVAVQELLLGSGSAVHHLGHVQLVARAVRPQDPVADLGVEGMAEVTKASKL